MANTIIQIKTSSSTATPTSSHIIAGELGYSYISNTIFIGTSDGNGVLPIGGYDDHLKTTAALITANAAYDAANAAAGGIDINGVYNQANNAYSQANLVFDVANAAFEAANTGSGSGDAFDKANTSNLTADAAFARANLAYTFAANNAMLVANSAFDKANAANVLAYNALPQTGGTISGDLVVQGNVTFSGNTTYTNTQTLLIGDNILTLNADLPSVVAPVDNAGMEVNRGSSANVFLLWNEATDNWKFTNDGTVYYTIPTNTAVETAQTKGEAAHLSANTTYTFAANTVRLIANSAYAAQNTTYTFAANTVRLIANSAYAHANSVYTYSANDVMRVANSAYNMANTANLNARDASYLATGTVSTGLLSGSYTGITGVGTLTAGTWNADTITVPYGGTGKGSFTNNGILFGNTTGSLRVTAAGSEGNVLQVNNLGLPEFGMLNGGSF